ncbi:hypothetical protein DN730_16765 [Marinomonas piezotolerans]|uniref:DUF2069 domain-containing protein n=1 Tax=Marinomonas piezotolerans TaxID=2213058 RepID=A0A370U5E0_9GAMM|nr:DUF2069 domain-containing protein [Marinomonas piezotolerans]RDL42982.1 hypothetical protein DN730_16765 [Marinomonas piezotolerans]
MAKKLSISSHEKLQYESYCQKYGILITLTLLALATTLTLWHLVYADIELAHPYILLSTILSPIALALLANFNRSAKGAIGICFISLMYFIAGVLNWTQISIWPIGMSETLLSCILFLLALHYARYKSLSELPIKSLT